MMDQLLPGNTDKALPTNEPRSRRRLAASRNRTRHGIFTSVVLLPDECRSKFNQLWRGLRENRRPVGTMEEILVEKLAVILWRYRRLVAAETANIQERNKCFAWNQASPRRKELLAATPIDVDQIFSDEPALITQIDDDRKLASCLKSLRQLRRDIEIRGFDRDSDLRELKRIYPKDSDPPTLLQRYELFFYIAQSSEEERLRYSYSTPEKCMNGFLAEIDSDIRYVQRYQRRRLANERERAKLQVVVRTIPDSQELDRFLRYGASLERSLERTLNQLDRIQRTRLGQPVAPRIEVDISG